MVWCGSTCPQRQATTSPEAMISPLGQRQMFQTINAEAVRAALDVSGQFQREAGQKQIVDAHVAEAQVSVPEIPQAEGLKTEARHGHGQSDEHGRGGSRHAADAGEDPEPDGTEANPADVHMDFLA